MYSMDKLIQDIDRNICKNIDRFNDSERGILSQNILSQLRNFVEYISIRILAGNKNEDLKPDYANIKEANNYVATRGKLKFLKDFHKLLQMTASHYTYSEEISERLMLKYYEYLLKIKIFLKDSYDLEVLSNINSFPIHVDSNLMEYYEKISIKIENSIITPITGKYAQRYYIRKIKPFYVNNQVYYEVTFSAASDVASKFDRIIAFTKLDIISNYSVDLLIVEENVEILDTQMPILIINDWRVSIRPCEINNFSKILGFSINIQKTNKEYCNLMSFLTKHKLNLLELIELNNEDYIKAKNSITEDNMYTYFFKILDKCRDIVSNNDAGANIIRYLLYKLRNKVIKAQLSNNKCSFLSDLYLRYGCGPFDKMPFCTSLIHHNPYIYDLLSCIDYKGREHEFLARYIYNNTQNKCELYTSIEELEKFSNIDSLINIYNANLYHKHANRMIQKYKNNLYIKESEEDTLGVIQKLKELSHDKVENYTNSVDSWLQTGAYTIDSPEKKEALQKMFSNSRVALIYGAAGTGKSTLINHISVMFNDKKKLFLANTNPAVENLKGKVKSSNNSFSTIAKFLSKNYTDTDVDLLFIDECSTVSNADMIKILDKATYKLLILVGDIYQIEAISFGNWFSIAKDIMPKSAKFELTTQRRTEKEELINLWGEVRKINYDILENLITNYYTASLEESIFQHLGKDEIILCLNYDGLYGINNLNRFLQAKNNNPVVQWGVSTYKVNDPVLFNESERFAPLIHNNLKGRIENIKKGDKKIQFDIEIDKAINELDIEGYNDLELVGTSENGNSIVRFFVNKFKSTDDDDDESSDTVVPFQIAYAVSIHKAQGLEYNSVKIVITEETDEMITHNIFYTAITRTKNSLKIYWSPESEHKILRSFEHKSNKRDSGILCSRHSLT